MALSDGVCFSSVVIWRCSALTRLENQLLIIGPSLQLLFSFLLIFTNWSSGKRSHLFLSAEGFFTFTFSLLELLSRVIAAAQLNIAVFNVVDIVLAAASFLPLLFYTLFIFSLVRSNIVSVLPSGLRNVVKIVFLAFIPAIIALDEVSSFIGIRRTFIVRNPTDKPIIGIGFDSRTNGEVTWNFFTLFALALMTAYQAMAFAVTFYRVVRVAVNQRRIEQTQSDEAHLFRGIGWIAIGLKIGAIETVLGFATPSFELQMTRRCMRALSRALICIGLAKGFDQVEDFNMIREEMAPAGGFRRSRLMQAIGGPMTETFHRMSPTATAFHTAPQASGTRAFEKSPLSKADMAQFAAISEAIPRDRVTVHYAGGAPMLHMRFSELDMPSPAIIVEKVKSRPNSVFMSKDTSSNRPVSVPPMDDPFIAYNEKAQVHGHQASVTSVPESMNTIGVVREMLADFPPLPSQRNSRRDTAYGQDFQDSESITSSHLSMMSQQTRASSQLMAVPRPAWHGAPLPSPVKEEESDAGSRYNYNYNHNHNKDSRYNSTATQEAVTYQVPRRRVSSELSRGTGVSRFTQATSESRPTSYDAEAFRDSGYGISGIIDKDTEQQDRPSSGISESMWLSRKPANGLPASVRPRRSSSVPSESAWDPNTDEPRDSPRSIVSTHHRAPRRTPTVSKTVPLRGSVHLQIHPPPPPRRSQTMEIVQYDSPIEDDDSFHRRVLRDDEVMDIERGRH